MKSRPYAGVADLRLMQALLIRDYNVTHTRIGDIAWRARYHTHHELSLEIRLWFEHEDLIAWTWLRTGGGLDLEVAAERRQDETLWTEMLDAVEATVTDRLRAGDELAEVYTWYVDDLERMTERLQGRGFVPSNGPGGLVLLADLTSLPNPDSPPPDYVLTHVADDNDVEARVKAHRAAFAVRIDRGDVPPRAAHLALPAGPGSDREDVRRRGRRMLHRMAGRKEPSRPLGASLDPPGAPEPRARAPGGGRRAARAPPRRCHSDPDWDFRPGG